MFSFWKSDQGPPSRGDRGAILVEYGLIVALIAIVALTMVVVFGVGLFDLFSENTTKVTTAVEISNQN